MARITANEARHIFNNVWANSSAAYRQAVPRIGATNWGEWYNAVTSNPALENEFRANLTDMIYTTFVTKASFDNKLAMFKKGFVKNGAGVKEYALGMVDAIPYATSDVEKQELKRYINEMFEAYYQINNKRTYPSTLGRLQFRTLVETPDAAAQMLNDQMDVMNTSSEWGEYVTTKGLLQHAIAHGQLYPWPVNYEDPADIVEQIRNASDALKYPKRKYNAYGIRMNTPLERQVLIITDKLENRIGVRVLAEVFHLQHAEYLSRRVSIDDWNDLDEEYNKLRAINPEMPEITTDDLAVLNDVLAVVCDEKLLQIWDFIREMWEKKLSSTMEINYFLHIWQIYALSPFSNAIVLVKNTASTELPATITAEVVSKQQTVNGTVFALELGVDGASLVGGTAILVETDATANAGMRVFRDGIVKMIANSAGAVLTADMGGAEYVSDVSLTPATEVGATIELSQA